MKLTVCFGDVRVVVPCGDGSLLVSELTEQAAARYKKATNKNADHWLVIHSLKSVSDGGLLDADDRVCDVLDDKDQIVAQYEEEGVGGKAPGGGGYGSASSHGTSSPELFPGGRLADDYNEHDVIITDSDLHSESTLIVRRDGDTGASPLVTSIIKLNGDSGGYGKSHSNNRLSFSDTVLHSKDSDDEEADSGQADDEVSSPSPPPHPVGGQGQGQAGEREVAAHLLQRGFTRDSARRSLANNPALNKWLDAQERQQDKLESDELSKSNGSYKNGYAVATTTVAQSALRSSPDRTPIIVVGGQKLAAAGRVTTGKSVSVDPLARAASPLTRTHLPPSDVDFLNAGTLVRLPKSDRPLGIHVLPYIDESGQERGLVVHDIEAGGRISQDGRIHVNDRIIEINGVSLIGASFQRSQDVFRNALQEPEIYIRILPTSRAEVKAATVEVKVTVPSSSSSTGATGLLPSLSSFQPATSRAAGEKSVDGSPPAGMIDSGSEKKVPPPAVPARNPGTILSSMIDGTKLTSVANTRRIGKKFQVRLLKGADGLGFSVTSRDTPAWGSAPIYIKTILPTGAAIKTGLIKPGDRLLQVNDVDLTGKTQPDTVNLLRSIPQGTVVQLLLSRQVDDEDNNADGAAENSAQVGGANVPVSASMDKIAPAADATVRGKEQLTLNIPIDATASGGLGLSVRGVTEKINDVLLDRGIFVKSILPNSAAAKDGRLRVNDQLLEVNGEMLEGRSNLEATEVLRGAMLRESPRPGYVVLRVARKLLLPTANFAHHNEARVSFSEPSPSPLGTSSGGEFINERSIDRPPLLSSQSVDDSSTSTSNIVRDTSGGGGSVRSAGLRTRSYYMATDDKQLRTADGSGSVVTPTSDDGRQEQQNISPVAVTSVYGTANLKVTDIGRRSQLDSETDASEDGRSRDDSLLVSDVEVGPFEREALSRQSMSEKRKGYADPKSTDLYQKVIEKRTTAKLSGYGQSAMRKAASTDSLLQLALTNSASFLPPLHESSAEGGSNLLRVGPSLGLSKSSSMESLQSAVSRQTVGDQSQMPPLHASGVNGGGVGAAPRATRMVRGRPCNDSFRAAVDKSYGYSLPSAATTPDLDSGSPSAELAGSVSVSVSSSSAADVSLTDERGASGRKDNKDKSSGGLLKLFRISNKKGEEERSSRSALVKSPAPASSGKKEDPGHKKVVMSKSLGDASTDQIHTVPERVGVNSIFYSSSPPSQPGQLTGASQSQSPVAPASSYQQLPHSSLARAPPYSGQSSSNVALPLSQSAPTVGKPIPLQHPATSNSYQQLAPQTNVLPLSQPPTRQLINQYPSDGTQPGSLASLPSNAGAVRLPTAPVTHSDRIMQLREEHQRRHRERSGMYPDDVRDGDTTATNPTTTAVLSSAIGGSGTAYQTTVNVRESTPEYRPPPRPPMRAQPFNSYSSYQSEPQSTVGKSTDMGSGGSSSYGNAMTTAYRRPSTDSLISSTAATAAPSEYGDAGHSHYQNIHEIRAYLQQHDYYQHEYRRRLAATTQQQLQQQQQRSAAAPPPPQPLQRVRPQHPPQPLPQPSSYDQYTSSSSSYNAAMASSGAPRSYGSSPQYNPPATSNSYEPHRTVASDYDLPRHASTSSVLPSEPLRRYIPLSDRPSRDMSVVAGRQYSSARNLGKYPVPSSTPPVSADPGSVSYAYAPPTGGNALQQQQGPYVSRVNVCEPERRYSGMMLDDNRWQQQQYQQHAPQQQSSYSTDPSYHSLPRRHGRPPNSAQV